MCLQITQWNSTFPTQNWLHCTSTSSFRLVQNRLTWTSSLLGHFTDRPCRLSTNNIFHVCSSSKSVVCLMCSTNALDLDFWFYPSFPLHSYVLCVSTLWAHNYPHDESFTETTTPPLTFVSRHPTLPSATHSVFYTSRAVPCSLAFALPHMIWNSLPASSVLRTVGE